MKKTIFALLACVFASSACFAQAVSTAVEQATPESAATQTVKGKVDSIYIEDPSSGMASRISIVNERGLKSTLRIKSDAVIRGQSGAAITAEEIKEGDEVIVEYKKRRKGTNMVVAITVIK